MGVRETQKEASRRRILEAATESLIQVGYARTTTVEVQRRAGVSRGALLHHFPSREDLAAAAVGELVVVNERVARQALDATSAEVDPIERVVRMLRATFMSPSMRAELELWAIARTDDELRSALREAELGAQRDLFRVIDDAFGPEIVALPSYRLVIRLTIELMRGISISSVLRDDTKSQDLLLDEWADIARKLLDSSG